MSLDFWRQLDIISPDELATHPVTVIGCGGIGSPTVQALAKMGVSNITVYDPDVVETHNLPNQIYRLSDIGRKKVDALEEIVKDFAGVQIEKKAEKYIDQPLRGVVISAVDSMNVRQEIWKNGIRYKPSVGLYLDARMGAEVCRIYSVVPCDPDKVRFYESTLYSDEAASELPCTARTVIYNTLSIAGLVANQVKKFARGESLSREIIFDLKTLTLLVNK